MRNAHLKTVRKLWKEYVVPVSQWLHILTCTYQPSSARIFFGRGAVMAKALGTTPEEEHKLGLSKLATVRLDLHSCATILISKLQSSK